MPVPEQSQGCRVADGKEIWGWNERKRRLRKDYANLGNDKIKAAAAGRKAERKAAPSHEEKRSKRPQLGRRGQASKGIWLLVAGRMEKGGVHGIWEKHPSHLGVSPGPSGLGV